MSVPLALAQHRVTVAADRYREARSRLRWQRGMAVPSPWEDDITSTQRDYQEARVELQEATKALNTARRRAR